MFLFCRSHWDYYFVGLRLGMQQDRINVMSPAESTVQCAKDVSRERPIRKLPQQDHDKYTVVDKRVIIWAITQINYLQFWGNKHWHYIILILQMQHTYMHARRFHPFFPPFWTIPPPQTESHIHMIQKTGSNNNNEQTTQGKTWDSKFYKIYQSTF